MTGCAAPVTLFKLPACLFRVCLASQANAMASIQSVAKPSASVVITSMPFNGACSRAIKKLFRAPPPQTKTSLQSAAYFFIASLTDTAVHSHSVDWTSSDDKKGNVLSGMSDQQVMILRNNQGKIIGRKEFNIKKLKVNEKDKNVFPVAFEMQWVSIPKDKEVQVGYIFSNKVFTAPVVKQPVIPPKTDSEAIIKILISKGVLTQAEIDKVKVSIEDNSN